VRQGQKVADPEWVRTRKAGLPTATSVKVARGGAAFCFWDPRGGKVPRPKSSVFLSLSFPLNLDEELPDQLQLQTKERMMAISDIRLDIMRPDVMQSLARDEHALLKMPADVYWAQKRANFGWDEIHVDVTIHKATIYLKEALNIKLDVKKIRYQQPPLKIFFNEDPDPSRTQAVYNYFNPQREGKLRIYFIDFFESNSLGVAVTNRNVVLMNGQLLLKPTNLGFSSFGDGMTAGLTLTHEIGHSLGLQHTINLKNDLMARTSLEAGLNVLKDNYYQARFYGLIYKRLEKLDLSI
jgi:hypothetical protein